MTKNTILLVDDDEAFRQVLTKRCDNIGLEVEQTCNLVDAATLIARRVPDIICVDVRMPKGNALSFCGALAARPQTSQVIIVMLTAQIDYETQQTCERLQAYYVEKTVDYWATLGPILRYLTAGALAQSRPSCDCSPSPELLTRVVNPLSSTSIAERPSQLGAKHILVADDDEDVVTMLTQRCSALGCSVSGVTNALDAINEIHRLTPDLVCLDVNMPSGNGLSVCEMMTTDERLRNIPVIVLTGRSDVDTVRRCYEMIVYYVEKSANTWERVEPLVRELLHLEDVPIVATLLPKAPSITLATGGATRDEQDRPNLVDALFAILGAGSREKPDGLNGGEMSSLSYDLEHIPWVLCIDDDADFSAALKIRLEDHGVAVIRAFSGMEGYRLAFTSPASAILLDFNMPNGQGDYILGRLKDNPVTKEIPVVVITGTKDTMLERRMLAMGAIAFLVKPVDFAQLIEHLTKHITMVGISQ